MEHTTCDLCGSDVPAPLIERRDRFSGKRFQYVVCTNCDFIYLNPRPTLEELSAYYPDEYEAYHASVGQLSPLEQWYIRRSVTIQLNFVERFAPRRGRLLDVGCATGDFLQAARERGWETIGVELVEKAARVARAKYGLDVVVGAFETAALPEAGFDVITLWDVLEHLPSPKDALNRCHRLLAPCGLAIFSIPNLASFDLHLFGRAWIGWDAPRHLGLFTESTLKRFFDLTGLELVAKRCILGQEGAFILSLDTLLGDTRIRHAARKLYPFVSLFLFPYRMLTHLFDRGPVIAFVARKRG